MTPTQRLAQALYGSHGPDMVADAQAYAKRLAESGFAIVPVEADNDHLEAMHNAMFSSAFTGHELPMLHAGYAAAIQAYQQEIET